MPAAYRHLTSAIHLVVVAQLLASAWQQQWIATAGCLGIVTAMYIPFRLAESIGFRLPPGFQLLITAFLFVWLFLGELHSFFERVSWWDLALHALAGFTLAIVGFLLVHGWNRVDTSGLYIRPGFSAVFAFCFATTAGALWEIAEFWLDRTFDWNLQKSMMGDQSGLTDTVIDLVADSAGALMISLYGFYHLTRWDTDSFLEVWIRIVNQRPSFRRLIRLRKRLLPKIRRT